MDDVRREDQQPRDRVARIQADWRRERPDVDVTPQGVIGRLHRLADRLTEQLCLVYGQYGLGEGEFDVLCALRRAGAPYERAPGELAAHTMVTTGAMTKRIDRLERAGLVTRRRSGDDQRGRIVALTGPGRELIDEAFTDHMRNERQLVGLLTPEEAASLEALLTTWLSRMEPPHTRDGG
ncbi:MarR family transcriptional regulator [Streptomyces sp. NPDC047071]|uniref:MarR family winged helix-turn-helix transcriptional regulator n=1 Tax=Streptomyces sp. NPDC047071 TaxID=3154808 RepID=UPI0034544719